MFSIETQTDFPTLHGRVETRGGVITEGTHKRALCSVPTLNALFIFLSSRSAVPTYIPTYLLRVVLFGIILVCLVNVHSNCNGRKYYSCCRHYSFYCYSAFILLHNISLALKPIPLYKTAASKAQTKQCF